MLAVMLPVLGVLLRSVVAGRVGMIVLSAIVAHTGWHWMVDRADVLWRVEWPRLDGGDVVVFWRWVAGVLLALGAARLIARRAQWPRSVLRSVGQPGPGDRADGARPEHGAAAGAMPLSATRSAVGVAENRPS